MSYLVDMIKWPQSPPALHQIINSWSLVKEFRKHSQFLQASKFHEQAVTKKNCLQSHKTGISRSLSLFMIFHETNKSGSSEIHSKTSDSDMLTAAARSHREQESRVEAERSKESRHGRGKRHGGGEREAGRQEAGERCARTALWKKERRIDGGTSAGRRGQRRRRRRAGSRWRTWREPRRKNLHGTSGGEKSMHPEPLYKYHLRREGDDGKRMGWVRMMERGKGEITREREAEK